jgi:hypothetical protein
VNSELFFGQLELIYFSISVSNSVSFYGDGNETSHRHDIFDQSIEISLDNELDNNL